MVKHDRSLEVLCTVLELKEKKKARYAEAMKTCRNRIGVETFKLLFDTETEHINRIRELYEGLKKGEVSQEACGLHLAESPDWRAVLGEITAGRRSEGGACPEDITAIEDSLRLEGSSIEFYKTHLKETDDPSDREFLQRVLDEEWERYKLLDDLRFYYVDTDRWFIEKNCPSLDDAGISA